MKTDPLLNDLVAAVDVRMPLAEKLFDTLAERTRDGVGVTRPAWSDQDSVAAALVEHAAGDIGLDVTRDPAGNIYATLPGAAVDAPAVLMGSHLDSVPTGGNYDGFAGVVAGLVVQAAVKDIGVTPPCALRTVGLRGEESVWYGTAYLGSRLAVGDLPLDALDRLKRGDTGRSLGDHIGAYGGDVPALRAGAAPAVSADNTRAFLELHIEQGPVLVGETLAVAIPTVIRGNMRFPFARCLGEYAHSAAVPREYRHDAALAVVELISALDRLWQGMDEEGESDTVFTVGQLYTDAAHHAMTKVPGECRFSINFGATDAAGLERFRDSIVALADEIAGRRRVTFELGDCVGSDPTPLDAGLRDRLNVSARSLGLATHEMPTVGHDASIFQRAGIPAAMVLVRNQHGSHNPHEAMEMADFAAGTRLLAAAALDVA